MATPTALDADFGTFIDVAQAEDVLDGEFDGGDRISISFRTDTLAKKVTVRLRFFAAIELGTLPIKGKANGIHEGRFATAV
jgi:hypothetical protein